MISLLLLCAAGLLAGTMNALAGGGSFVSLPAMIAAGVPSVPANASNTVALYPGQLASVLIYRDGLGEVPGLPLRAALVVTMIGGLIGALLLLWTPPSLFDRALPWLLLAATLMLAAGPRLGPALQARWQLRPAVIIAVQFVLGIYGGYFGGAVGLMMLAAWSLIAETDVKLLNAPRTLLVTATNTIALICFIAAGAIHWPETLALGLGAAIGGTLGAMLGKWLPSGAVRLTTLALAVFITTAFFVRAYG